MGREFGIKADFIIPKQDLGKIRIKITVDEISDELTAIHNPGFDSHEMVIRKSDYVDRRTFATRSDKAAYDIDRRIVKSLNNPNAQLIVETYTTTNK